MKPMLDPETIAAAIYLLTPKQTRDVDQLLRATDPEEVPFVLTAWVLANLNLEDVLAARAAGHGRTGLMMATRLN